MGSRGRGPRTHPVPHVHCHRRSQANHRVGPLTHGPNELSPPPPWRGRHGDGGAPKGSQWPLSASRHPTRTTTLPEPSAVPLAGLGRFVPLAKVTPRAPGGSVWTSGDSPFDAVISAVETAGQVGLVAVAGAVQPGPVADQPAAAPGRRRRSSRLSRVRRRGGLPAWAPRYFGFTHRRAASRQAAPPVIGGPGALVWSAPRPRRAGQRAFREAPEAHGQMVPVGAVVTTAGHPRRAAPAAVPVPMGAAPRRAGRPPTSRAAPAPAADGRRRAGCPSRRACGRPARAAGTPAG